MEPEMAGPGSFPCASTPPNRLADGRALGRWYGRANRLPCHRRRTGRTDGGALPRPLRTSLPPGRCGGLPRQLDTDQPQYPGLCRRRLRTGNPCSATRAPRTVRDASRQRDGHRFAQGRERLRGRRRGRKGSRAGSAGAPCASRHGRGRRGAGSPQPARRRATRPRALLPDLRRIRSARQADRGGGPWRQGPGRGGVRRPHLLARRDPADARPRHGPRPGRAGAHRQATASRSSPSL